jgi:hypothetical protein
VFLVCDLLTGHNRFWGYFLFGHNPLETHKNARHSGSMSALGCWHQAELAWHSEGVIPDSFSQAEGTSPAITDAYLWHLGRKENGSWPNVFATRTAAYSYRSATDGSTLIAFRAGK